jgi:hypothetical protein
MYPSSPSFACNVSSDDHALIRYTGVRVLLLAKWPTFPELHARTGHDANNILCSSILKKTNPIFSLILSLLIGVRSFRYSKFN